MLKGVETYSQAYLVRQLPNPTVFLNTGLEVVLASDSWLELFGFQHKEAIGRPILGLFPEPSSDWKEVLAQCLRGKGGFRGTDRTLREDGREVWFEWINTPWFGEDENIRGVLIQVTDITRQIGSEIENEKLSQLFSAQSENARIGSWSLEAHTGTLTWSEMTRLIHEVPDDFEPNLESALGFYREGYSRNTISMAVYRAIEHGEPWKEQLQLTTYTGREIWVVAAGKPLYKNGQYVGLLGTFQDVTEMYLSSQKTLESEKLLRTVVDNLPINVYIKDLESRKVLVNKAECAYMGVKDPEALLGKADAELFPPEAARTSREEDLYVMDNGKPILGKETVSVRNDGSVTHFLSSKIPLYDADNQIYGLMGISLDITDLKQKESELRDLIRVTALQNKKLVGFAHIVSHNLRSHTANFSMLLEFLAHEQNEAEKSRILSMLTEASDNLLETLDNLNEVVAINTNHPDAKTSLPLRRMIEKARARLAGPLEESQGELINQVPAKARVEAEPAYLENILFHFLSNALKYRHPARKPRVCLSFEKTREHSVLVIADNGLGIDLKKNGDKLFGMYKTFHEHPDARGIGLFICKNQIEAMNGFITTRSKVGEGTTFKIHFHD